MIQLSRGGYSSLESMVYSALDEEDKSEDAFRKAYQIGIRGYREITLDVTGATSVAIISVMANKVGRLPADYSNYITVGVMNDEAKLATLSSSDEISLSDTGEHSTRFGDNPVQYDSSSVNALFDQPRDTYFPYQSLGSLGIGSLNNIGEFRIDKKAGYIIFGSGFPYSSIIMEYQADANFVNDDYLVDNNTEAAIIAYIQWRMAWRRKDISLSERLTLKAEYYNQKRNARKRMNPIRLQDINDAVRRHIKAAPRA